MTEPAFASPRRNYFYATIAAAAGLYFIAVGAGLLPIPGGPSNLHGPLWVLLCAGGVFSWPASRSLSRRSALPMPLANCRQMRPLAAPRAVSDRGCDLLLLRRDRELDRVRAERATNSGTIMTGNARSMPIGRTAFGVGAVIIWLCTAESSIRAQRAPASSGRQIVRSAKQCCYAKVSCAGLTRRDAAALSL
jgi:hypothetical protein